MKKTRLSEEAMVRLLREAFTVPVADVARKHGVSDRLKKVVAERARRSAQPHGHAPSNSETDMTSTVLEDTRVPVRVKLAALWTSVMFCYVYGDYFELYVPGKLQDMLNGEMALGAVTQGMLVGTATLMAVPSVMIFLSIALPAAVSRWLNVGVGLFYASIMTLILINGAWAFYMLFAAIEILLTLLVVWYAWRWPRQPAGAA